MTTPQPEQFSVEQFEEYLKTIPQESFSQSLQAMFIEKNRRDAQPLVTAREDEIAREYHTQNPPEEDADTGFPVWRQPHGAHDAWPIDATVSHGGKVWDNIARVPNVWEPGNDGPVPTWQERVAPEPEPDPEEPGDGEPTDPEPEEPGVPEWEIGIDYQVGDLVTYQGTTYKVIQAHTSAGHWTPDAVPAMYSPQ